MQQQAIKVRLTHEYLRKKQQASEYAIIQIQRFEEGWLKHEADLKQYSLTQAKLTDWDERTI